MALHLAGVSFKRSASDTSISSHTASPCCNLPTAEQSKLSEREVCEAVHALDCMQTASHEVSFTATNALQVMTAGCASWTLP